MKRYFLLGLIAALSAEASFGAVVHQGSASVRIEKLLAEKQAKLKKLESCKGTTKNLKIAGLSTLGITAAGVVVNVAEAVELNKKEKELTEAQKKYDTALEKNKGIAADKKFENWCSGDDKVYSEFNKSCTISQSDDNVTNVETAKVKIQQIVDGTCADISQNGDTYTATCKKDGHNVSVTITGKAAAEQQEPAEPQKAEEGETSVAAKEELAEAKNEVAKTPAGATGNAEEQFKTACEKLKKDPSLNVDAGTAASEQYCRVDLSKQGINGDANRKATVKELATRLEGVTCDTNKIVPHTTDTNQMVMNCNATTGKYNRFFVRFGDPAPRAQNASNREGLDEGFAEKCRELGGGVPSLERDGDTLYYLCKKTANNADVSQAGPLFQKFFVDFGSVCGNTDEATIDKNGLVTKKCLPSDGSVYGHYVGMKFSAQAACLPGIASQSLEIDEEKEDIADGFSLICSCPEGQVYNETSTACVCDDSKAFMPGKRECVDQPDGNKHYIKDGYWTACGANQIANGDKNGCECDTGFGFKDITLKQCVQCGKGSQCYVDTSSKLATFCGPLGKVLKGDGTACECPSGKGEDSNGNCIDCNETANNGYIDANNKCHICAKGTKPNQDTKTCETASGN